MKPRKVSGSAFDSAVRSLSRRNHSRWELKTKLLQKGFPSEEIKSALDHVMKLGYLNDQSFAYDYCRHRLKQSPRGRKLLSVELKKRGLSRNLIEQVLDDIYQEFSETDLVAGLVEKWRRSKSDELTESDIAKLAQSLSRKGFDWDCIRPNLPLLNSRGE
jgi:regulatory protein